MYNSTQWYRVHIVVLTSRSCRGFPSCAFIRELMYSASIRQVPLLPLFKPLPLFACPSIGTDIVETRMHEQLKAACTDQQLRTACIKSLKIDNDRGAACIRLRGNSSGIHQLMHSRTPLHTKTSKAFIIRSYRRLSATTIRSKCTPGKCLYRLCLFNSR